MYKNINKIENKGYKMLRNFCYVLKNTKGNSKSNAVYVGYTNRPDRRIRQHNGEISGGAKYTTRRCHPQKPIPLPLSFSPMLTPLHSPLFREEEDKKEKERSWEFAILVTSPDEAFDKKTAMSLEWYMKPHRLYKIKTTRPSMARDAISKRIELMAYAITTNEKFTHLKFEIYVKGDYIENVRELISSFSNSQLSPNGRFTIHPIEDIESLEKLVQELSV